MYSQINISSGHSINCQGASDVINEVTEARRVVNRIYEICKLNNIECYKYHDTSSNSRINLSNIANWHNQFKDGIDVSIHFNASNHTSSPIGTECWYVSQSKLANNISKAISEVSGLKNRGGKQTNKLYVLNHTNKPMILIEICFCDSVADCTIYNSRFDDICCAIVRTLTGKSITLNKQSEIVNNQSEIVNNNPPSTNNNWISRLQAECNNQGFSNQKVDGIPGSKTLAGCPLVRKGARGNITKLLQEKLVSLGYNTNGVDGIFGSGTERAVKLYQKNNSLISDGIVGRNTWKKLLGI